MKIQQSAIVRSPTSHDGMNLVSASMAVQVHASPWPNVPLKPPGRGNGDRYTRCPHGLWRSLVARCLREAEAPGSSPGSPTRQAPAVIR